LPQQRGKVHATPRGRVRLPVLFRPPAAGRRDAVCGQQVVDGGGQGVGAGEVVLREWLVGRVGQWSCRADQLGVQRLGDVVGDIGPFAVAGRFSAQSLDV
jgi:hypothetical protein